MCGLIILATSIQDIRYNSNALKMNEIDGSQHFCCGPAFCLYPSGQWENATTVPERSCSAVQPFCVRTQWCRFPLGLCTFCFQLSSHAHVWGVPNAMEGLTHCVWSKALASKITGFYAALLLWHDYTIHCDYDDCVVIVLLVCRLVSEVEFLRRRHMVSAPAPLRSAGLAFYHPLALLPCAINDTGWRALSASRRGKLRPVYALRQNWYSQRYC